MLGYWLLRPLRIHHHDAAGARAATPVIVITAFRSGNRRGHRARMIRHSISGRSTRLHQKIPSGL
jgi:hypothetical protein